MIESLQEKTQIARRQHIREAATRVFAERGFRRATIREVAREAGVADGTIYNVFPDKEALLFSLLDPLEAAACEQELPPPAGDPVAIVANMIERRWKRYTPETLAMLRVVLSEALVDSELRKIFLERVISPPIKKAGPVLKRMTGGARDRSLASQAVMALVFGALVLRLLGEETLEARAEEVPAYLAKMIAHGLIPGSREDA